MQVKMSKNLFEYKAVVFDVDGTLYYQPPLRRKMAVKLCSYYLFHFWKVKDLLIVKEFRKVREHWVTNSGNGNTLVEEEQYQQVADKLKTNADRVKRVIYNWIYDFPLPYLKQYKDEKLAGIIESLKVQGIITAVYSDYPVEEKLKAMGIHVEYHFSAANEEILCLKPDPKGLKEILKKLELSPDEVLMIGDRYSKDGLCAVGAEVDYVILPSKPSERDTVLKKLRTKV